RNSSHGQSPSPASGATAPACADRTAWKFVPPKPNALTPARRSADSHGLARSRNTNGLVSLSHDGLGFFTCSVGGRTPRWIASAALMTPASPAAHLVWPMFDLTEPSVTWPGGVPAPPNTSVRVASSVRSPTTVPLP